MDFTLSEELQMIRDMARDFVTNELMPIESQTLVLDGQPGKRGAPIPREKYNVLKKKAIDQGLHIEPRPSDNNRNFPPSENVVDNRSAVFAKCTRIKLLMRG